MYFHRYPQQPVDAISVERFPQRIHPQLTAPVDKFWIATSLCYFLVAEQESNQRIQLKGALRANRAPLKNPPAALLEDIKKSILQNPNFIQKIGTFSE